MTKSGDPTRATSDQRDRRIARLEKALREALARSEAAESMLEDQQTRLKALGLGREETMRALSETREELHRVSRERDELRRQLTRIDGMQTSTIALPDNDPGPTPATADLPSLEDLMAALGHIEETRGAAAGHLHQRVQREREPDPAGEMLSPVVVFPEKYATTAKPAGDEPVAASRMLVLLDAERPMKYPLFKDVMTIGRADVADIHIDNEFLSRIHARVISTPAGVTIEDAESKNGIRVNAKLVPRQQLRHGDVVDLGRLRFRFIDAANDEAD